MKSFIAALRNLVLPFGATSGTRIVLDGVNGKILVYDVSNNLVGSIIADISDPFGGIATYYSDGSYVYISPNSPATTQYNPATVGGHTFAPAQVGAEHEAASNYVPRLFLISPKIDSRNAAAISLDGASAGTSPVVTVTSGTAFTVAGGNLSVTGTSTISSDESVGGNLSVTGNATITGDMTFGGSAYTSFTPGNSGWTPGNGTWNARYKQLGKMVHCFGEFTFGSTTTVSGTILIGTPVAAAAANPAHVGSGLAVSHVASSNHRGLSIELNSTTAFLAVVDSGSVVNATVPFTWTTNDVFRWNITYEAA